MNPCNFQDRIYSQMDPVNGYCASPGTAVNCTSKYQPSYLQRCVKPRLGKTEVSKRVIGSIPRTSLLYLLSETVVSHLFSFLNTSHGHSRYT